MTIKCALRWGIASVGKISLLGVTHPIWENISSAGQTPVEDSHLGPQG